MHQDDSYQKQKTDEFLYPKPDDQSVTLNLREKPGRRADFKVGGVPIAELKNDDIVKPDGPNKYQREIKPDVYVDVYDVIKAFDVACPATQHAVKKLLCPGQRGVKDKRQDLHEAMVSVKRAIELL